MGASVKGFPGASVSGHHERTEMAKPSLHKLADVETLEGPRVVGLSFRGEQNTYMEIYVSPETAAKLVSSLGDALYRLLPSEE